HSTLLICGYGHHYTPHSLPTRRSSDLERTTGDTGSATITDIILDHYGAKFGAEKCARRTNIQTTSVRAVFADIGGHQPTESIGVDRKSTRLNSSHVSISYAVFCLKKKK